MASWKTERQEDNIKMDTIKVGYKGVNWIELAQDHFSDGVLY